MLKAVIKSMRPHQWYKNFIIFICIIFSKNIFNLQMWMDLIVVFIAFCMLAGSQYMLNDIKDAEKDRLHPKKKYRPIAAGLIPCLLYTSHGQKAPGQKVLWRNASL